MFTTKDCPVPILQNAWEFDELLKIFATVKPKNIVEIGSFYGGTLWFWSRFDFVAKITSVDMPIPETDDRWPEMIKCRNLWYGWMQKIKFNKITGDSTETKTDHICDSLNHLHNVEWLFIDGGHEYKTVKSDYENYSRMVMPGGYIVLHDIKGLRGPRKLWNQITKHNKYLEIYNPHNGWGIGIIQKK